MDDLLEMVLFDRRDGLWLLLLVSGFSVHNANELHVACGIDPFPFRMLNTGPHLPPHHTTPHPPSHSSSEQSLLVEFDNKATPLNRVDEDVAARESKVTPSADKLNPASSDSLCEKCQSVYMLSKRKKKDLGY